MTFLLGCLNAAEDHMRADQTLFFECAVSGDPSPHRCRYAVLRIAYIMLAFYTLSAVSTTFAERAETGVPGGECEFELSL